MGKQLNEHSQFYWVMREAAGKVLGVLSTAFLAAGLMSFWTRSIELRYDKQIQELKDSNTALSNEVTKIKAALALLKTTPIKTSWYGQEFHGRKTASGEIFDKRKFTAAHRTLPLGSYLVLKHGKRTAMVRVNDRGPVASTGRSLDISERAAEALGMKEAGEAILEMRRVR